MSLLKNQRKIREEQLINKETGMTVLECPSPDGRLEMIEVPIYSEARHSPITSETFRFDTVTLIGKDSDCGEKEDTDGL